MHTRGSWSLRGRQIEVWVDNPETRTPQPCLIATVAERYESDDNARLIAAAPELLAMCQRLIDRFAPAEEHASEAELALIRHAEKLIAKAGGEES